MCCFFETERLSFQKGSIFLKANKCSMPFLLLAINFSFAFFPRFGLAIIKKRFKRRILLKRLLRLCSLLFLILFLFLFFLFLHPLYKYFAFFFDPFLVCLPIFSRRFNHHKCTNKYSCHNEIHPKRYRHFPPLLTCPHLLHLMRRKRCLFL